jgi:hypothetical protein
MEVPLPFTDPVIKIIHIAHTSILVLLTKRSIHVFNQYTLLPISSHFRSEESIEQHGWNIDVFSRHTSVNAALLQKLLVVDLVVQTQNSHLEIIQISINYSKSLYEVSNNDDIIQTGLPLSTTNKSSISKMLLSATKNLFTGNTGSEINLENIESPLNADDMSNYNIEYCKISVVKLLKIGMGIKKTWLKQNSHNLIIFNDKNNRDNVVDNYFQIINISNYKHQLFVLSSLDFYNDSLIKFIDHNQYQNYFLFVNQQNELWYLQFVSSEDGSIDIVGHKLHNFDEINSFSISFNPQNDLLLMNINGNGKLAKINDYKLTFLKSIPSCGIFTWSPNGNVFTVINDESRFWKIYSKFGNKLFDSKDIYNELDHEVESQPFLKAFTIVIGGNSRVLYLIDQDRKYLYYCNLLNSTNDVFYDHEYISLIDHKRIVKFPLLPKFKTILAKIEDYNGNETKSKKCVNGKLHLSLNQSKQFAISYGEHVSVSTPFNTGGDSINQLLWFNFKNYYAESFNFVHHAWFKDYLVLINRRPNEDFIDSEGSEAISTTDEILVVDCRKSKFGAGGTNFKFDSDLILWKYDVNSIIVNMELNHCGEGCKIVLVTWDFRLIILGFRNDQPMVSPNGNIPETTPTKRKLFINVNKTIQLGSIQDRFPIRKILQISLIGQEHFLFLIDTGEFFLLKNYVASKKSMYDLIKISTNIEWFKLQQSRINQHELVYTNNGELLLVYDIEDLLDSKTSDEEPKITLPISIAIDNFVPLYITKNLELIGLENLVIHHNGIILKNKLVHKLILNDIMEYDLVHEEYPNFGQYKIYKNFEYCLELILFKYLTENSNYLDKLIKLIEFCGGESIYINCLRKIEVGYWDTFFKVVGMTPIQFMTRLIAIANVELCYQYLIVYLNYKKEDEDDDDESLDVTDRDIILQIIVMLDKSQKWEWCFELCRFIKLLEPTGEFLSVIKKELTKQEPENRESIADST